MSEELIRETGRELDELVRFQPRNKQEVASWSRRAYQSKEEMIENGMGILVPHFLWHYLDDAKVRFDSKEISDNENRAIVTLVEYLKKGIIPSEDDL
jgi:hypothetical protein